MNKTKIQITGNPSNFPCEKGLANCLERLCYLRFARKVGHIETVNNTQLGKLKQFGVPFEVINH
jgi:hypothetical protein